MAAMKPWRKAWRGVARRAGQRHRTALYCNIMRAGPSFQSKWVAVYFAITTLWRAPRPAPHTHCGNSGISMVGWGLGVTQFRDSFEPLCECTGPRSAEVCVCVGGWEKWALD